MYCNYYVKQIYYLVNFVDFIVKAISVRISEVESLIKSTST